MVILIGLLNHRCWRCTLTKLVKYRPSITRFYSSGTLFPSYLDTFLENLVLEDGIKHKSSVREYLKNVSIQTLLRERITKISVGNKALDLEHQKNVHDLVCCIQKEIDTSVVPNNKLYYLLVYFTNDGNVNGVKAVQSIVEKYNIEHFKSHSQYNHYLAEAFWINGKIQISLQLFSEAYDNVVVRPRVKVMLTSLFPLIIAQHGEATLCKAIHGIEKFSAQKRDDLILACLWKELFQSTWFSDQEQATQLLQKNKHLLKIIQWMVPTMGKNLLRSHRVEDFYRLIQFSLENELKSITGALLRIMFEYYYIHQDIERCTAVVKYSANLDSPLTEEQQRRYVNLLLKSKDAISAKLNVKRPQNLKYKF